MRISCLHLILSAPIGALACAKTVEDATPSLREDIESTALAVESTVGGRIPAAAIAAVPPVKRVCDPGMVEFRTQGGKRFCMDTTEVTQAAYAGFLESANAADQDVHDLCSQRSNPDFAPRETAPCTSDTDTALLCGPGSFDPIEKPDEPVVCVDFCDAVAFCAASGKQLCGTPGSTNGRTLGDGRSETGDFALSGASSDRSQFFSACSGAGSRSDAYARKPTVERCAGAHRVGSVAECTTEGITGVVFDLMGGVGEWEDSCTDDGRCRVRGGMFGGGAERGRCDQPGNHQFADTSRMIGFRCCADLASQ
jgi:sulfatase modifying factor 1